MESRPLPFLGIAGFFAVAMRPVFAGVSFAGLPCMLP
jgi:hypothetical protein